jgi:hypothetical protein
MMKKYKYEAKIKQPQTVGNIKLSPQGGTLSEREIKTLKQDAYGASLLEKGLLIIGEKPIKEATDTPQAAANGNAGETVPGENHTGRKPR